MSNSSSFPAELHRFLERIAHNFDAIVTKNDPSGATQIMTSAGLLSVVAVPNRSEIQISFTAVTAPNSTKFPLWSVQEALGTNPHAISFESAKGLPTKILKEFIERFLESARSDPDGLKERIQIAYSSEMSRAKVDGDRREAERLWKLGRRREAASIYRTLPSLTNLEIKRLERLAREASGP